MVTYNRDIPDGPNNPSRDQPLMKTNTNSVDDILKVDHVSFNTANSGFHKQVTFNAKTTQGAQTDPQSVVFTNDGVANTAHPQLYFKNSQATFPLSSIRAFGSFSATAANGVILPTNSYNVVSITGMGFPNTSPKYRVLLNTGTVNSNNVIVFILVNNLTSSNQLTYSYTDPNLDLLCSNTAAAGFLINFLVMQI